MGYYINGKMYGNAEIQAESIRAGKSPRTIRRWFLRTLASRGELTGNERRDKAIRDLQLSNAIERKIPPYKSDPAAWREMCSKRMLAYWDKRLKSNLRCKLCGRRATRANREMLAKLLT